MSRKGNKDLEKKIKNLVKNKLSKYNFTLIRAKSFIRQLEDGFIQGVDFQPGATWLSGKYTMNIFWNFNKLDGSGAGMRIGRLTNQPDLWLPFEPEEELEKSFAISEKQILEVVMVRFKKYNSIENLVKYYECNEISKKEAFGIDIGWACFNLGACYYKIGKKQKAIREFTELVENHSIHPNILTPEWMIKRKEKALEYIEKCKLLPDEN